MGICIMAPCPHDGDHPNSWAITIMVLIASIAPFALPHLQDADGRVLVRDRRLIAVGCPPGLGRRRGHSLRWVRHLHPIVVGIDRQLADN